MDFGRGLSLRKYNEPAGLLGLQVDICNNMLDGIDAQRKLCLQTTRMLRSMSTRIMLGVESRYGRDSIEYQNMGGKKRSRGRMPKGKKDI
jgi:hypothetical protein